MTTPPVNAAIWFEIPVLDLDAGMAFYGAVLSCQMEATSEMGPQPISFFPYQGGTGVSGHLYAGKPSTEGSTIHLFLPDSVEAASERCRAAGGKVISDPVTIPAGRFVYATDPDGNSIGLFEPKAA
ncbi:hypothetical protein SAMN06273572_101848 [Monaibacterium marinum]|uniref:VOC domain-containing protein n=1 Tax=Pontivivens marinum TaxID=1690039 RepID=A0A2C9CNU5_9RHOB|nr:VOC family protein [Monaibacterium marinum]SOH92994.1 hypothetical protein SAMN06273572_101848 [Monaibacterium marinum]